MFGFAWESVWEDTGIVLFGPTSVIRSRFAAIALADDDRVKKENELIAYGLCPMPLQ